jgi:hypothetical protein
MPQRSADGATENPITCIGRRPVFQLSAVYMTTLPTTPATMRSVSLLLLRAGLAGLAAVAHGQSAASSGDDAGQCSCSGLDYTDGGSYLVDGSSTNDFTFTSEFEGLQRIRLLSWASPI